MLKKNSEKGGYFLEQRYIQRRGFFPHHISITHRDVLQVEVLVVHSLTQLPDFLFDLFHLLCGELILVGWVVLVELQQLDHKLQAGPVQIHVKTIPTQNVHQSSRAQSKILTKEKRPAFTKRCRWCWSYRGETRWFEQPRPMWKMWIPVSPLLLHNWRVTNCHVSVQPRTVVPRNTAH